MHNKLRISDPYEVTHSFEGNVEQIDFFLSLNPKYYERTGWMNPKNPSKYMPGAYTWTDSWKFLHNKILLQI